MSYFFKQYLFLLEFLNLAPNMQLSQSPTSAALKSFQTSPLSAMGPSPMAAPGPQSSLMSTGPSMAVGRPPIAICPPPLAAGLPLIGMPNSQPGPPPIVGMQQLAGSQGFPQQPGKTGFKVIHIIYV